MNRKQLGRPVFETGSGEPPASGVREPLSLRQVELGLLSFFDVEVVDFHFDHGHPSRPAAEPAAPSRPLFT